MCDSWAVRVVEEIFKDMSSILMFHHILLPMFFFRYFGRGICVGQFLCKLLDNLFVGYPNFLLEMLLKTLALVGGFPGNQTVGNNKKDGSVSTTLL